MSEENARGRWLSGVWRPLFHCWLDCLLPCQVLSIEEVERIMDETQDAIEYQRVGRLLHLKQASSRWKAFHLSFRLFLNVGLSAANRRDVGWKSIRRGWRCCAGWAGGHHPGWALTRLKFDVPPGVFLWYLVFLNCLREMFSYLKFPQTSCLKLQRRKQVCCFIFSPRQRLLCRFLISSLQAQIFKGKRCCMSSW